MLSEQLHGTSLLAAGRLSIVMLATGFVQLHKGAAPSGASLKEGQALLL